MNHFVIGTKTSFSFLQNSKLSEIKLATVSSLISDFRTHPGIENVKLGAFKDGLPFNISMSEKEIFFAGNINSISKLNCSFRITNIHLISQNIKSFVEKLYRENKIIVTVNLYITPNSDSQCFLYHGDPQDSLIYQIHGSKEWSFPKVGEEYSFIGPYLRADASNFNEEKLAFTDEKVILNTGDILTFPYNLIHKAKNLGDEVSAHLTFSTNIPSAYDLKFLILSRYLGIQDVNENYFSPIDLNQMIGSIKNKHLDINEVIDNYYESFSRDQEIIRNHGRKY